MMVSFQCEKNDWETFKRVVGEGNASSAIRNFIASYGEKTDVNERKIRKEFEIADGDKKKSDVKWQKMKVQIEEIDQKKKAEELERLRKEEKFRKKMQDIEYQTKRKDMWRI